jgi:hypothetical protein
MTTADSLVCWALEGCEKGVTSTLKWTNETGYRMGTIPSQTSPDSLDDHEARVVVYIITNNKEVYLYETSCTTTAKT